MLRYWSITLGVALAALMMLLNNRWLDLPGRDWKPGDKPLIQRSIVEDPDPVNGKGFQFDPVGVIVDQPDPII